MDGIVLLFLLPVLISICFVFSGIVLSSFKNRPASITAILAAACPSIVFLYAVGAVDWPDTGATICIFGGPVLFLISAALYSMIPPRYGKSALLSVGGAVFLIVSALVIRWIIFQME